MVISELVEQLQAIKEQYGDVEVIGPGNEDIEYVDPQKFVNINSPHNINIVHRYTEDMDETYLEDSYEGMYVGKGVCVKLY